MLKKELEERVAELEKENQELCRRVVEAELSEEAISICRAHLEEVGHRGMFFDDVVRGAVQEIKALRYDVEHSRPSRGWRWRNLPGEGKANERPMRAKEGSTKMWATWFAIPKGEEAP